MTAIKCNTTNTYPSDDSHGGIPSTGPTATVSEEFVGFADTVDVKPLSIPAFWLNETTIVL